MEKVDYYHRSEVKKTKPSKESRKKNYRTKLHFLFLIQIASDYL